MHVNLCLPFLFGTKVTSRVPGKLEMMVAVRGAFRLAPGKPPEPIEDLTQVCLQGDVYAAADDDRVGPLTYPTDFADFKLKADVLLRGTCHVPGGEPARVRMVKFAVGAWSKSVRVTGPRLWRDGIDSYSDPAPFRSMPLTWQNAFGGPGFERNPSGKGHGTPDLPTVEDPGALVRTRRDRPAPAAFGPVSPEWVARRSKRGTDYGASWKRRRAPFYSSDFDWSYFNSAPSDQQLPYLRGDEELSFESLHESAAVFGAKLPGVRPRVLCRRKDGFTAELTMNLDTLVAEPDEERIVLVWRGLVEVHDDQLDDVRTLFIASEPLAQRRPDAYYLAELEALDADPIAYQKARLIPPELQKRIDDASAKADEAKRMAEEASRSVPTAPAFDPSTLPKDPGERVLAVVRHATADAPADRAASAKAAAATIAEKLAAVDPARRAELEGQAARRITPSREGVHDFVRRSLSNFRDRVAARGGPTDRLDAARDQVAEADELRPSRTAGVPATAAEPPGPPPPDAPGPGAKLFDRDLSGQDLRGIDLTGAILLRAKLVGTNLAGANLTNAQLAEADLEGADLTGANLTRTNLTKARARGAKLDGATIDMTILQETDLEGASLRRAAGKMASFSHARLPSACIDGARLEKAMFLGALADGATFRGAELEVCCFHEASVLRACFDEVRMHKSSFIRCRMIGASFYRAKGTTCSWQESILDEADFRYASLRKSHLNKAKLDRANLHASDFRGGRFERASLDEADFTDADLMSVSFCKARISAADFARASLYDAKFLGAVSERKCNFDGANLERAIWEQP